MSILGDKKGPAFAGRAFFIIPVADPGAYPRYFFLQRFRQGIS
jgi:hypothetical protein